MNIVDVGYLSTHYYAIDIERGKLLVDCGWPGTLPRFSAQLKRKGISLQEIGYFLVTHFHPDHAGLTQELKRQGCRHILLDCQAASIARLSEIFREKPYPYVEIQPDDSLLINIGDSRTFLAGLGLQGEILHTPGHSQDSVSLILDEGFAFTGDLQPQFVLPQEDLVSRESWDKIHQHRITRIYPGHGGQES